MAITKEDVDLVVDGLRRLLAESREQAQKAKSSSTESATPTLTVNELVERLSALESRLSTRETFRAGDIVRWKEGLQNRVFPTADSVGIVVEVINPPIFAEQDVGSPYFREPIDVRVGTYMPDGTFACWGLDSARLTAVTK